MTATAIIGGLLPILWGHGTGASVMKRIAAPMVGGMVSATILILVVIPVVYSLWRERLLGGGQAASPDVGRGILEREMAGEQVEVGTDDGRST